MTAAPKAGAPLRRYPMRDLAQGAEKRLRKLDGPEYLKLLPALHERLDVARYLEIGTRWGDSLAPFRGTAVAVDRRLNIKDPALRDRPGLHFFEMTSDAFFAAHDPKPYLGGPADLAFVDGMHHYEFALRDFLNCEAHCHPGGVVMVHDAIPLHARMARRLQVFANGSHEGVKDAWTGDVWRVLRVLARWRPDLRVIILDAAQTGLALVTGLDPASTVLRDNLPAILAEDDALGHEEATWWDWVGTAEVVCARSLFAQPDLRAALFAGA
jgi:predicted O-methyltransferase YrrM